MTDLLPVSISKAIGWYNRLTLIYLFTKEGKSSDSEGIRPMISLKSNTILQEDEFGNYIIKYKAEN